MNEAHPNHKLTVSRVEGQPFQAGSRRGAHAVLLTATITPPQTAVVRADPAVRLKDYQDALSFYLGLPSEFVDRIVFVDNSASNLQPLIDVARSTSHDKAIEFIAFAGNDHPVSYGKAYGEFKLMDFGLRTNSLITGSDRFWKITGRLRLLNIVDMIKAVPTDIELMCDLHNFPLVRTGRLRNNRFMELRTFCCTRHGYDQVFRGIYETMGQKLSAYTLYDVISHARSQVALIPRFPLQPQLAGHSGRSNRAYDSRTQVHKAHMRALLRTAAPWLWI